MIPMEDCRYSTPIANRFTLQRVRLDRGGYDSCGAYWGLGQRLYWYCEDDGAAEGYIRASDRLQAKAQIRDTYPNARFYR